MKYLKTNFIIIDNGVKMLIRILGFIKDTYTIYGRVTERIPAEEGILYTIECEGRKYKCGLSGNHNTPQLGDIVIMEILRGSVFASREIEMKIVQPDGRTEIYRERLVWEEIKSYKILWR